MLETRSLSSAIGFLPAGHERWIAGTIYTQNLARALRLLPADERPAQFLMRGPGTSPRAINVMTPDVDGILRYGYRRSAPLQQQAMAFAYSVLHGLPPISLEHAAQRHAVDTVFPVCVPWHRKTGLKQISWIPDFQHRHHPEYFDRAVLENRDRSFQRLLDQSEQLVVSSQDAMKDLKQFYRFDPNRVATLPFVSMSAPGWFRHDPKAVAQTHGLPDKYLIFPSKFWVHKNHARLFEAIRAVRHKGHSDVCLVCTGQAEDERWPEHGPTLRRFIADHGLDSHIRILGLLGRDEQIALLRRAAAIVQPSLFEGWSAIVEDGRSLGKTVLMSDIAVHREQDLPDRLYYDPYDINAMAAILHGAWPNLSPGPDVSREAAARIIETERGLEFARTFMTVLNRARHPQHAPSHGIETTA